MQDKITVIIPVYNVQQYLSKCLDSVINQTYKNLEIIVINDGSTDKSCEICNYYKEKDNRIILINQENQGVSIARNNGVSVATGKYIGWVDSDDWIELDMFSTLYENIITYCADISTCERTFVENIGNIKINDNIEGETITIYTGFHIIKHNVFRSALFNKLFKHYLFNDIVFPKNKQDDDVFVMHKILDKAKKVVSTSQSKYYYFMRTNGLTHSPFTPSQLDLIEAFIDRYEYLTSKYMDVEMEKIGRQMIFVGLIDCINSALKYHVVDIYIEDIQRMIDKVKKYDVSNCMLTPAQEKIMKLIFDNIKKYVFFRKLSVNKLKDKEREYINGGLEIMS